MLIKINFPQNNTRFLFNSLWIFLILFKVEGEVWKEVTACYGSDYHCCQYQMECTVGTTIVLGKLMYGIKNGIQECQFGVSNCNNTEKVKDCCSYNPSDTFVPFSANNLSAIFENCEGKSACAGSAPRQGTAQISSYVWMQYACVSEKNVTDMCKSHTIAGNHLFVRFNMTTSNLQNNDRTSQTCSCQISTPSCHVAMTTTLVDFDFNLPLREISQTSSPTCSSSSLEFVKRNMSYNCQNTQLYTSRHTFERMNEITVQSPYEIVSLKNVNAGGMIHGPSYIVLYFKTLPEQPLLVKCFEPGVEALTKSCQSTTSNEVSTLFSTISSSSSSPSSSSPSTTSPSSQKTKSTSLPSYSSHGANVGVSSDSTAAIFPFKYTTSPTTKPTTVQSLTMEPSIPSFPYTRDTSHDSFSTKTKTHIIQTFSSSSVSHKTFPKTLLVTKQSPRRPFTYSRPQSHQSGTSVLPDSIPTLMPTRTAIFTSTKRFKSTTNVDTSTVTVNTSNITMSSGITGLTNFTSTTIMPILSSPNFTTRSTISDGKTTSSESRHGNSSSNPVMTVSVDQSENTTIDPSTIVANSETHSTAATTRKPTDDNENNNGLITGITVAVVIVVLIIVAVVMVCLCIRIKRKEKVRRNYIRNTNIFYSFPEDYSDAGNTLSESPEVGRREPSFSSIPRSQIYESVGNPSPSTLKKSTSPLYFDQYKINSSGVDDLDIYEKDHQPFSRMPNDNSYVGETSNETIDFVNGVEHDDALKVDSNSNVENGGKSVTFDPSVYYAKVRKEGRTKF